MIKEIETTTDGREIVVYRPENAADQRELRRMVEAGELTAGERPGDLDQAEEADLIASGILSKD